MSTPETGTTAGSGSGPTLVDGVDIDAVAAAVRGCGAVDDLYSSPAASVASYLPGRQVPGIRIAAGTVTVQVRSRWSVPVVEVAESVRSACRLLVAGRKIDVVIADIEDPPPTAPAALAAAPVAEPVQVTQPGPAAPGQPVGSRNYVSEENVDGPLLLTAPDSADDVSPIPPGTSEVPWPPISEPSAPPGVSSSETTTPTGAEIPTPS